MVRPKLLFTFYIVSFLPLFLIATFFYVTSTQVLKEELGSYMVETGRQVDLRLHSFADEMENLTRIIHFDSNVQKYLNVQDQNDPATYTLQLNLRDFLRKVVNHRDYLWSIFVINDNGNVLFYSEDFVNPYFASWWHEKTLELNFQSDPLIEKIYINKDFRLYPPRPSKYLNTDVAVEYGGRIYQLNEEKGTLILHFDPDYFSNMTDSIQLGETGFVALLSETGEPLFENKNISPSFLNQLPNLNVLNEESGYELVHLNGVRTLVAFNTSEKTGWKIVGVVPFHEVSGKINSMRNGIYIMSIIAILFILLFSKYLAQVITSPLLMLQNYMKQAEKGDLSLRVPLERGDEFGKLTRTFNNMLERLEQLKDKVYMSELREMKLQLLHRETELKALQMQINPHFLYNTLNTMKCIGEVFDVKEVSDMSESLSKMFQYSIDHEKYKMLYEEIEHVKAYLQIIQIRFPGQIECKMDIPSDLNNIPVLKLIIQPLVENAIEHGIIPKGTKGNIYIRAKQIDEVTLALQVIDDGVGISEDKLEEIQAKLVSKKTTNTINNMTSSHIGLSNVQQRLHLNYGDRGKVKIASKPEQGTMIELQIPIDDMRGGQ